MKKGLIIISLILITACSHNDPIIETVDTEQKHTNSEPVLVEQTSKEETDEFIEFSLEDEQIMINLKMVPILDEYLSATEDRQKVIEKMKIEQITVADDTIYLLEFSCQNDRCSYIVFNQSQDDQSFLIADLAKSVKTFISPDQTKVLFQFNRVQSPAISLDHLVVVDVKAWEPIPLIDTDLLNYAWPFITIEWMDNETIAITKPDILNPTNELINKWLETVERPVTEVVLHLQSS